MGRATRDCGGHSLERIVARDSAAPLCGTPTCHFRGLAGSCLPDSLLLPLPRGSRGRLFSIFFEGASQVWVPIFPMLCSSQSPHARKTTTYPSSPWLTLHTSGGICSYVPGLHILFFLTVNPGYVPHDRRFPGKVRERLGAQSASAFSPSAKTFFLVHFVSLNSLSLRYLPMDFVTTEEGSCIACRLLPELK